MARKSEVLKTFPKLLPVALTDAELQVRGNALAHAQEEVEHQELAAKADRAALRETKKNLALKVHELAEVVRKKAEKREVKCILRAGKKEGWVEEVRTDTNEVIDTRRASDAETQGDLLEDPELDA